MNVLKCLISLALIGALAGCVPAPQFIIKPIGDKFSDVKASYGFIGENNRLSKKSSTGGIHIDNKGVYIEPYVFKNKDSNAVVSMGFYIFHFTFEPKDGFRPIKKLVFLTDSGNRIESKVDFVDSDFQIGGWNNLSKEFQSAYNESGITSISFEDFMSLANSKWVEVKVFGGKRSQVYNKDEILPSFLKNLNSFYRNKVFK